MKKTFILSLCLFSVFCLSAKTYNMQELGADITGKKKCTELISSTIKKAAAEGGGTIYFPAGEYLTAAIHLESNITLELEAGATLKFSTDFDDYLPFVRMRWEGTFMNSLSPLIYAHNVENVAIKGRGTLDGQGNAWWAEGARLGAEIRANNGKITTLNDLQQKWVDANKDIKTSPYYAKTMEYKFYRPPFIQFLECKNIHIEGITIKNSPFWTINPEGCDDILIHGVTINNPPTGPNTDGINPSSCRNVRISNCFINVGDDCVTLKSGRDLDGRIYGRPNENITITNCVMLAGHGGVVIGSEMSGGVKRVAISNCVFDGTDAGIRLKASRGRGGIVEDIAVDNIVMRDIQRNAFIFDLFYDRDSQVEPVSERTPIFRSIRISNVIGQDIRKVGYITGIEEMPVDEIAFSNITMSAVDGFTAKTASNLHFHNVDLSVEKGSPFSFTDTKNIILDNVRSKKPLSNEPIVLFENVENALINNCFQLTPADVFLKSIKSDFVWGQNYLRNVKTEKIVTE